MDDVAGWFDEYLAAFMACARRERDVAVLLDYYAVPLLVTTAVGAFPLMTADEVTGLLDQQVATLWDASYARTELVTSRVTVLNSTSALVDGTFSRQRGDGTEIDHPTVTYLIADSPAGRRIHVLAAH
ncbi:hypothetical protein GCM10010168_35090 [Actinoplanes ianthinogenes]|uniref:DUF6841 domain-containing protein n=1 Tax=Actinoplanes ianthinogenes TaxID=122358 RepID=A0ABN6CNZ3_9ACTN|nr:hypothetical protein [Actinoplanes ianthinogenes]BCJ46971.1 hypothetical protein Aiant_76280 [Actinoplanes ianthinogenes]GGR14277.1 hypothetical protein GCM10010168_35090 [Actinoplanes ianthinogenes]